MFKKFIGLAITVLLLFSLAACNEVTLAQYKTDAKAELDAHVATKVEIDYSGDNWTKILGFVTTGKTAIDDAADKAGVDSAVTTAKTAINGVPKEVGMSISFEEIVFGGYFVGGIEKNLFAVFRYQEECISFFEEYDIEWSNDIPIWEHYDNDFFQNKALIFSLSWETGSEIVRVLNDVRIIDNTLALQIICHQIGDTVNDNEMLMEIFIEVNKVDVANVEEIKIYRERCKCCVTK